MYFCHNLHNHHFYVFLLHLNMIKSQIHLKVKVKFTQYQCEMLKNQFYVLDCKWFFCDLCGMQMVCL